MKTAFFSSAALDFKPWSPSKLGVLESCSQKFVYQYVDKPHLKQDEEVVVDNTALELGSAAHKYAELQQKGKDRAAAKVEAFEVIPKTAKNKIKIKSMSRQVDNFQERMKTFKQKNNVILDESELRLAVLPNFVSTDFWNNNSILRGVLDRVLIVENAGKKHAIAIDIKTGKCKSVDHYSIQLESYGILLHSKFDLVSVQSAIYSTTSGELTWYPRKILVSSVLDSSNPVVTYINKTSNKLLEDVAPEKGRHCSWCKYKVLCEKENGNADEVGSVK